MPQTTSTGSRLLYDGRQFLIDRHGLVGADVRAAGISRGNHADEGLGGGAYQAERLSEQLARVALRPRPGQHAPVNPHMFAGRGLAEHMCALQVAKTLRGIPGRGRQLGIDVRTNIVCEVSHRISDRELAAAGR